MTDLESALAEAGSDHSSLETVLVRLTDLQRRRSQRAARLAAAGAGLAVVALAGSIFVLRPAGTAPEQLRPAIVGVSTESSNPDLSSGLSTGLSADLGLDPAAARRAAELEARRKAAADAASAEAARARAAAQASAGVQEQDTLEAAVLQREAAARSQCQYLLTRDPPKELRAGAVDAGAATRLARECLGSGPASAVTVSWVVAAMDRFSDVLGYQQKSVATQVAVLQVVGVDAGGDSRHWLIVLLPDGGHTTVDGQVDGQVSIQQYPVVMETPPDFDLALLGTVHRP
ncbi:hypothetical protein ABLG96_00790 [Nakamurella sp. A5-74]|uniref:Anti-sigma factor n=1 Tax=Nakamurella sp. A5-74 TaxID=3158264 RepID=A0AAU8DNR1_9ACTN